MLVEPKTSYKLITADDISFQAFIHNFEAQFDTLKASHLIIDLTRIEPLKTSEINTFLEWSSQSRKAKKSFIIVVQKIDIDAVSEKLICAPTLLEAQDTFEMEEMERDLGF